MRILYFFVALLATSSISAQTAEVLFVNTNTGTKAESLNVEFLNQAQDTVYASVQNVPSPGAAEAVEVPVDEIIAIRIKDDAGAVIYSSNNTVYSANQLRIFFYSGTQNSTKVTQFSGYNSTSAGKVKIDFRNSTNGLPDVDAIMRTSQTEIADDISYGDGTFTFSNVFTAEDDTLDLFEDGVSDQGLFGYDFPASEYEGEYIVLFTYGTASDNDVYVLDMEGQLTKLNRVDAFVDDSSVGLDELFNATSVFDLYPNPASSQLSVDSKLANLEVQRIQLVASNGEIVLDDATSSANRQLSVVDLNPGVYHVVLYTNNQTYSTSVMVQ